MEKLNKTAIIVAIITACGTIIGAGIHEGWWQPKRTQEQQPVIAGVVVDQTSNSAIRQATISLSGRTEMYVTDDLGNFRIELRGSALGQSVRMKVSKNGYRTYDEALSPPAENLVIQLQKQ
jgi:hypothetical protein